ncbi:MULTISPECIES: amino acid ABC transporter permease [Amycolatopsis]|uniref:amino acid ABC transporter permease n=1 Tax=Amycolatopsis TaxID=1813 RepID=UPI00056B1D04|nr:MULTISPECIES: amino acid ABC transporter permease [Amycolatopsis]MCG3755258.1 amino acid ABC transporter permease [Amycolatopsis sp. Poz14]
MSIPTSTRAPVEAPAGVRFARRRQPARWLTAGVALVLAAMFAHFLITNPRWDWRLVGGYLFSADILRGLLNTVLLTLISSAAGLVVGVVVALMRLSGDPVLRWVATAYIWFIRAIPALVLLLLIFFLGALLPKLSLGIPFGPEFLSVPTNRLISQFSAAVVGLALVLGAYSAEIFRAGILSVPAGQLEAATALAMTGRQRLRRVVLPQAIRVIIPPLSNELVTMFKNTSLVSVVGYTELLTTVQLIYGRTYQTIPLLLVACLWYLVLTSLAMIGQRYLERRFGRGFTAGRPGKENSR